MISKSSSKISIASLCVLALSACEDASHTLRLVTPTESVDASIAEEVSSLLNEDAATRIVLTSTALAEEAALEAVISGEADLALVSNNLPFQSDIATVIALYPTVLHIASRVGIASLNGPEAILGRSVYAGPEGSASRLMFERIARRVGLSTDQYRYVENTGDTPDIVVVFSPIAPEHIAEIQSLRNVYPDFGLSSMGTPDEIGAGGIVDAAVLLNPNFQAFVIPVGTYGALTSDPVVTVAVDKILVTRSDLDATVVYDLINDILRLRPALAAKRPGLFQQLNDDFDVSRSTYLVHAGTQAYLQRSAPTVYERYSGVAEVVVTAIVALASASIAAVRIFRMRRKNRIDTFYSKTIELGRSVDESTSAEESQRVIREVRQLQSQAFDLLVEEKLAADESFRIFITLSNDILRQLEDPGEPARVSDA